LNNVLLRCHSCAGAGRELLQQQLIQPALKRQLLEAFMQRVNNTDQNGFCNQAA
jgi:hypothetical protein